MGDLHGHPVTVTPLSSTTSWLQSNGRRLGVAVGPQLLNPSYLIEEPQSCPDFQVLMPSGRETILPDASWLAGRTLRRGPKNDLGPEAYTRTSIQPRDVVHAAEFRFREAI